MQKKRCELVETRWEKPFEIAQVLNALSCKLQYPLDSVMRYALSGLSTLSPPPSVPSVISVILGGQLSHPSKLNRS